MRILVTGGTGFVGKALVGLLTARGHELLILTRSDRGTSGPSGAIRHIQGDPTRPGPWQDAAAEVDGVINLAGASIFQRWTPKAKQAIVDSRLSTTRHVVEAMCRRPEDGKVLLSTSAVGYYGFRQDEDLDESAPPGSDFLAELCRMWEAEAVEAEKAGVRVVRMRFGIVLGPDGGALGQMLPLFRKGLGGRLGSGRQWFSWIHHADLVRAVVFFLERPDASGPYNLTAPQPVRNIDLTRALSRALARPAWLPAPAPIMKLVLGEFGSVLLNGQKVLPRRLLESGFSFDFPSIDSALTNLLS